jgi:asparagine synthase (glutamine-hydrolysing)
MGSLRLVKVKNGAIVLSGSIHRVDSRFSEEERVSVREAKVLVEEGEGGFAFVIAEVDRAIVGRAAAGVYPLYFGEASGAFAVASKRKALWRIGVKDVASFPPGAVAILDDSGVHLSPVRRLHQTETEDVDLKVSTARLRCLLEHSVRERVTKLKEVAVAFSGGLDSSIIALLVKNLGVMPYLIHVSLPDRAETKHAEKAAEALGLPLHIHLFSERVVQKTFSEVVKLIEGGSPIDISVGIPVFLTARKATEEGLRIMLMGQGADELFGGYWKYLDVYKKHGREYAQKMMFKDVTRMHDTGFADNYKICLFHDVELRLPFASFDIAKFAISLPLHLKIASARNTLRKKILRKVGEEIDLPPFIVRKPKKAIQYTTGVNNVIRKMARKGRCSVKEYTLKAFQKFFGARALEVS